MANAERWDNQWSTRKEKKPSVNPETDPLYKLLEYFVSRHNSLIIEIGSGSGLRTLSFAKQHGIRPILLDYSEEAIKFAIKNAQDLEVTANYIMGDLLNTPTKSDLFDVVWSGGVYEHFRGEDRQKSFDEMYRICKPGGNGIVVVPNSLNLPYRLVKAIKDKLGTWPYGDEYPFTKWELSERMRRSGFKDVETVGIGAILSPYRWFLHGTSYASKFLENPTPFKTLNEYLRRVDLNIGSNNYLNNIFGRELGVRGTK